MRTTGGALARLLLVGERATKRRRASALPSLEVNVDPVTIGLAVVQGAYFAGTAVWALFHVQSFMRVTGARTDVWLVKTVAALVFVIGAALLAGAARGHVGPDLLFLALGSTTALAIVDLVYVLEGTIARIYLLDALIELLLAVGWAVVCVSTLAADAPFSGP